MTVAQSRSLPSFSLTLSATSEIFSWQLTDDEDLQREGKVDRAAAEVKDPVFTVDNWVDEP